MHFSLTEATDTALFTSHSQSHQYLLQEKLKCSVLQSQAARFHKTQWTVKLWGEAPLAGTWVLPILSPPVCAHDNRHLPAPENHPHLATSPLLSQNPNIWGVWQGEWIRMDLKVSAQGRLRGTNLSTQLCTKHWRDELNAIVKQSWTLRCIPSTCSASPSNREALLKNKA